MREQEKNLPYTNPQGTAVLPGDELCKKCGGSGTYRYESSSEASYSVYCECPVGNKKQKELNASENIISGGES